MTAGERIESFPKEPSLGWMLSGVGISVVYFLFVAWTVVVSTGCDFSTALWLTAIHATLFAGIMTWALQAARRREFAVREQLSLRSLILIIATVAVCLSFSSQAVRLRDSEDSGSLVFGAFDVYGPVAKFPAAASQTLYDALYIGFVYLVCSLPFAAFLGNGLYWIWRWVFPDLQRIAKRH